MTKRHVLIADDDPSIRALLRTFLESESYVISEARTGGEVINVISDGNKVDLLLMDILQRISEQNLDVPVVLMTAFGTSNVAIKAIQLGAHDYITKPFELEDVLVAIRRFFEYQDLSAEVKAFRTQVGARDPTERIVGRSNPLLDIYIPPRDSSRK